MKIPSRYTPPRPLRYLTLSPILGEGNVYRQPLRTTRTLRTRSPVHPFTLSIHLQLAVLYDFRPVRRLVADRTAECIGRVADGHHADLLEARANVRRLQDLCGVLVELVDHRLRRR